MGKNLILTDVTGGANNGSTDQRIRKCGGLWLVREMEQLEMDLLQGLQSSMNSAALNMLKPLPAVLILMPSEQSSEKIWRLSSVINGANAR